MKILYLIAWSNGVGVFVSFLAFCILPSPALPVDLVGDIEIEDDKDNTPSGVHCS